MGTAGDRRTCPEVAGDMGAIKDGVRARGGSGVDARIDSAAGVAGAAAGMGVAARDAAGDPGGKDGVGDLGKDGVGALEAAGVDTGKGDFGGIGVGG